jgi:hypothetical protein
MTSYAFSCRQRRVLVAARFDVYVRVHRSHLAARPEQVSEVAARWVPSLLPPSIQSSMTRTCTCKKVQKICAELGMGRGKGHQIQHNARATRHQIEALHKVYASTCKHADQRAATKLNMPVHWARTCGLVNPDKLAMAHAMTQSDLRSQQNVACVPKRAA